MNEFREYLLNFIKLIKSKKYTIPLIAVTVLSYAYRIANQTISRDDTALYFYYNQGGILAQGRFSQLLLPKILGITNLSSPIINMLAVIFLIISCCLFSSLFMRVSQNKLFKVSLLVFSTFFISYPLITEIFVFDGDILNVSFSYLMIPIILMFSRYFITYKKIQALVISSLLLTLVIPLYESFASVYIFGALAILILEFLFNKSTEKNLKANILKLLKYSLPLAIAIILDAIINKVIKLALVLPDNHADNKIMWINKGVGKAFSILSQGLTFQFGLNALVYLPITMVMIASIIAVILLIRYTIKHKNPAIFILFTLLIINIHSLSIIAGKVAKLRTYNVLALFVGFIFMLLYQEVFLHQGKKKIAYIGTSILLFFLLFSQVNDINNWFYLEKARYDEEVAVARQVGFTLESEYDMDKPVVFIGHYKLSNYIMDGISVRRSSLIGKLYKNFFNDYPPESDYLYSYTQTNVKSILSYGSGLYFTSNSPSEEYHYFKALGFNFKPDNWRLFKEAKKYMDQLPSFPKKGYILETNDCIVVKLGENE